LSALFIFHIFWAVASRVEIPTRLSGEWAKFTNKVVDRLKNNITRTGIETETEKAANFQLPCIN